MVAALASVEGCVFGANAADFPFATSAAGATGKLIAMNQTIRAELIEVRENEIVFLDASGRLILLRYQSIQLFQPDRLDRRYVIRYGEVPSAERKQLFRAISHFPQGMTPDIQRRMLQAQRQTDFVSLR